jgi:hypothetical protein
LNGTRLFPPDGFMEIARRDVQTRYMVLAGGFLERRRDVMLAFFVLSSEFWLATIDVGEAAPILVLPAARDRLFELCA